MQTVLKVAVSGLDFAFEGDPRDIPAFAADILANIQRAQGGSRPVADEAVAAFKAAERRAADQLKAMNGAAAREALAKAGAPEPRAVPVDDGAKGCNTVRWLRLDAEDEAAVAEAIKARLAMPGGLPDGGGNVMGRVIAEICRGWMEFLHATPCGKGR